MTKPLCERYDNGNTYFNNRLAGTRYLAAVKIMKLPKAFQRDNHIIRLGYAVGFGQWFFFDTYEPAVAFGHSVRMSADCHGYGIYEAASEIQYCELHGDERVLLIVPESLTDPKNELDALKRFVQSVKEHSWSSHWREPTGYITKLIHGSVIKTNEKSLPL